MDPSTAGTKALNDRQMTGESGAGDGDEGIRVGLKETVSPLPSKSHPEPLAPSQPARMKADWDQSNSHKGSSSAQPALEQPCRISLSESFSATSQAKG